MSNIIATVRTISRKNETARERYIDFTKCHSKKIVMTHEEERSVQEKHTCATVMMISCSNVTDKRDC